MMNAPHRQPLLSCTSNYSTYIARLYVKHEFVICHAIYRDEPNKVIYLTLKNNYDLFPALDR